MTGPTFAPSPGAAPTTRMLAAQAGMELRLTLRRGESLLLTLVIPVLLLVVFATTDVVTVPEPRVDFLTPGILALAVMSTAFTGQAIATGYERHYAVLKRLGATALPRSVLIAGKVAAVVVVELLQAAVLLAVAAGLGWSPHGNPGAVVALMVLGTATFAGLGLLMAGTLRAEATLAAANLVYLLFLVVGGLLFPVTRFPDAMRPVLQALPVTALADGLRHVLRDGTAVPVHDWVTLLVWAVGGLTLTVLTFRWE